MLYVDDLSGGVRVAVDRATLAWSLGRKLVAALDPASRATTVFLSYAYGTRRSVCVVCTGRGTGYAQKLSDVYTLKAEHVNLLRFERTSVCVCAYTSINSQEPKGTGPGRLGYVCRPRRGPQGVVGDLVAFYCSAPS